MPKSSAKRKEDQRERDESQGIKRHEVRIPDTPEAIAQINTQAEILRKAHSKARDSELLGEQE